MSMQLLMAENAYDDGGLGGFDWSGLIGQGFGFGNNFINAKYAKDAAKYQAQAPSQPDPTRSPGGGPDAAITAGAGKSGFYIGQTFVPWSYLVFGGGAFALIQMTGFTRKGR
jgi:hypothetical protein